MFLSGFLREPTSKTRPAGTIYGSYYILCADNLNFQTDRKIVFPQEKIDDIAHA